MSTTTTLTAADPVRIAELAFAAANLSKTNADAALEAARAVTATARARIAKPAVDDDAATLIQALRDGESAEAVADLVREIGEGKVIAAMVELNNARDLALIPQFQAIVSARIAACLKADAARKDLEDAQMEFDKGYVALGALKAVGKTGIPNISELAGRVIPPVYPGREIHSAATEREFWPGVAA